MSFEPSVVYRVRRRAAWALVATLALTSACAGMTDTQQRTGAGAAVGTFGGALLGGALGGGSGARAGAVLGGMAGVVVSYFWSQLVEADRLRADAAARAAIDERKALAELEAAQRIEQIEQKASAEREAGQRFEQIEQKAQSDILALEALGLRPKQVRSDAARAEVEQQTQTEKEAARQAVMALTRSDAVTWRGQESGAAQATGPVQVDGREDCEQVREYARIGSKEYLHVATYCRDPSTGKHERV
jgi:osmotically inducible lipoprotein OsmB